MLEWTRPAWVCAGQLALWGGAHSATLASVDQDMPDRSFSCVEFAGWEVPCGQLDFVSLFSIIQRRFASPADYWGLDAVLGNILAGSVPHIWDAQRQRSQGLRLVPSVIRDLTPKLLIEKQPLATAIRNGKRPWTMESSAEKFCTSSVSPKFLLMMFCTLWQPWPWQGTVSHAPDPHPASTCSHMPCRHECHHQQFSTIAILQSQQENTSQRGMLCAQKILSPKQEKTYNMQLRISQKKQEITQSTICPHSPRTHRTKPS